MQKQTNLFTEQISKKFFDFKREKTSDYYCAIVLCDHLDLIRKSQYQPLKFQHIKRQHLRELEWMTPKRSAQILVSNQAQRLLVIAF